ncbi:hypothetical protein, partial [Tissierella creatinophila]
LKDKLNKIVENYKNINQENKYVNNILLKLNGLDMLEKNIYDLKNKSKKLILYKNINNVLHENKKQINYNEKLINYLSNINIIESIVLKIDNLKSKLGNLQKFKLQMNYSKIELQKLHLINDNLKDIDLIKNKTDIVEIKINKLKSLNSIKKKVDSVSIRLNTGESYIKDLKGLEEIDILLKELDNKIDRKHLIVELATSFHNYKLEIENQQKSFIDAKKSINDNLKTYEALLMKSEICPFCLSDINENKIEHIIEHYS